MDRVIRSTMRIRRRRDGRAAGRFRELEWVKRTEQEDEMLTFFCLGGSKVGKIKKTLPGI